jgi:putative methyltransferase (TIGR04325 family)
MRRMNSTAASKEAQMASITEIYTTALQHHRSGEVDRAKGLDPSVASYHSNLGAAYHALGFLDNAVESLRNAVRADADYADFEGNRQLREVTESYGSIPFQTMGHHLFLPMLAGLVSQQTDTVRILDFGGATGTALLHLLAGVGDSTAVELNVVETESACKLGEELWPNEPRIKFHRAIADVPRDIDIVHINSALQYVEDYRAVLEELCAFQASYFMLPRLATGDFPTYASAQMNLWDDVVAYWFINIDELIGIMKSCGYRLISKSVEALVYDQSNFPAEYRMHRTSNLLFGLADGD